MAIVRLLHPQSADTQDQEMPLASSADRPTCSYGTEFSNHYPSISTLRSKELSRNKMKLWAIFTEIDQWMPNSDYSISAMKIAGPGNVFSTLSWQVNPQV